jgi:ABC-type sugar transport system substrate-binding protein
MRRPVITLAAALAGTLALVGPVLASQCPKLIAQINAAAGNRFDNAAYQAKQKAAEAQKLHAEGKHAESEKAANEGLSLLGISK